MFDFVRNLSKSGAEKRQEALSAYLDDTLSARQRQAFEQQLAQDADLRRELEAQRLIRQQMRALPRRAVPRSFTLDPAVYGVPRKERLVQAYPILRAATALTAFFFVAALALSLFSAGGASQTALMTQTAAEAPVQEGEIAAAPEMAVEEAAADTAVAATETAVEVPAASGALPAAELPFETTVVITEEEEAAAENAATEESAALSLPAPAATPLPLATQAPSPTTTASSESPRPEATELADIARAATVTSADSAEAANVAPEQATAVAAVPLAPPRAPVSTPVWLSVVLGGLLLILLVVTLLTRRRL